MKRSAPTCRNRLQRERAVALVHEKERPRRFAGALAAVLNRHVHPAVVVEVAEDRVGEAGEAIVGDLFELAGRRG